MGRKWLFNRCWRWCTNYQWNIRPKYLGSILWQRGVLSVLRSYVLIPCGEWYYCYQYLWSMGWVRRQLPVLQRHMRHSKLLLGVLNGSGNRQHLQHHRWLLRTGCPLRSRVWCPNPLLQRWYVVRLELGHLSTWTPSRVYSRIC